MIFQHSWEALLAGRKTQTSRIWRDSWQANVVKASYGGKGDMIAVHSAIENKQGIARRLYYIGQMLSVQKARGTKAIARIRILELARRDVRDFDDSEIEAEGFPHRTWFLHVWTGMHDKAMYNKLDYDELGSWHGEFKTRPKQFYDALVIKFELVS